MNTYNFIEKLGSIGNNVSKRRLMCDRFKFLLHIGTKNRSGQKELLRDDLKSFRHEIQKLPFELPTRQGRKVFLNNLFDELVLTKANLKTDLEQSIAVCNKCISEKKIISRQCFPKFLKKKYLTMARKAHQKLHMVYSLQQDTIDNSIEILQTSALNDGLELKEIEIKAGKRVITDLSSPELSYIFYMLIEKVSIDDTFDRMNLSKIIASNFSTKKASAPKYTQIRKHFTQVDDSVKKRVSTFFLNYQGWQRKVD